MGILRQLIILLISPKNAVSKFAQINMSFARILFYECSENLLSFARFICAVLNYYYR